ncbi:MAG: LOG family protein [Patescibacteria group bacterium]
MRFFSFRREFKKKEFRVVIFGSARIKKNDKMYKQVFELAKQIGEMGAEVVTGGGPGLMEAAAGGHEKGTPKNNHHTIGLNIRLPFEQKPNKHLDLMKEFKHFSDRLNTFTKLSNVIVVAPGGIGTILEIFFSWQLMQVHHINKMPIICIGEMWEEFFKWMRKWPLRKKLIEERDLEYVVVAKNIKQAMRIIKKAHKAFKEDGAEACVNWKKY